MKQAVLNHTLRKYMKRTLLLAILFFMQLSIKGMEKYRETTLSMSVQPVALQTNLVQLWTPELERMRDDLKSDTPTIGNIFLHGAPGVGKTMTMQLLAQSTGRPAYELDTTQIFGSLRGASKRLKDFFTAVYAEVERTGTRAFVFADEIDRLVGTYHNGQDQEVIDALDCFLEIVQQCSIDPQKQICIIGGTYNKSRLNPAYLSRVRAHSIELKAPDAETRRKVLIHYIHQKNIIINEMMRKVKTHLLSNTKTPESIDVILAKKLVAVIVWYYNHIKKDGSTWYIASLPEMPMEKLKEHWLKMIKDGLIDQDVIAEFEQYNNHSSVNRARLIDRLVKATEGYVIRDLGNLIDKAFLMISKNSFYVMRGEHFKAAIKSINAQFTEENDREKSNNLSGWQKMAHGAQFASKSAMAANAAVDIYKKIDKLGGWTKCWTYINGVLSLIKG